MSWHFPEEQRAADQDPEAHRKFSERVLVAAPAPQRSLVAAPVAPTRRDLDEAGGAALVAVDRLIPPNFERERRTARQGIEQYHQQALRALAQGNTRAVESNLRSIREMHKDLVRTWQR